MKVTLIRLVLGTAALFAVLAAGPRPAQAFTGCASHGGIQFAETRGPVVHIICFDGTERWI